MNRSKIVTIYPYYFYSILEILNLKTNSKYLYLKFSATFVPEKQTNGKEFSYR